MEDLIYVLLSNRTPLSRARTTFEKLRETFPTWRDLIEADRANVAELLRPLGFGEKRTDQIRSILRQLQEDFGTFDPEELWSKDDEELLGYLTSFCGVSDKVARCVMMYALGREVLPVDVHVHRIASRLGWTARKRPEQAHDELEALLPPHRYYAFHVTCIAHGRARCTASNPDCEGCPIQRYCQRFDERRATRS